MGYTHYWFYTPSGNESEKHAFARVAQRIHAYKNFLAAEGVVIRGPLGTEEAIITNYAIRFNGDRVTESDHETFSVVLGEQESDNGFNFCKTARKPYDRLVCLALIALKDELGEEIFHYTSDGTDTDWNPAYQVYEMFHDLPAPRLEKNKNK